MNMNIYNKCSNHNYFLSITYLLHLYLIEVFNHYSFSLYEEESEDEEEDDDEEDDED
jgi:hypothetical protein